MWFSVSLSHSHSHTLVVFCSHHTHTHTHSHAHSLTYPTGVFYKNLSIREYRFLMNNKPQLTLEELYNLLVNNELTNFDPVMEAFKVL